MTGAESNETKMAENQDRRVKDEGGNSDHASVASEEEVETCPLLQLEPDNMENELLVVGCG